MIWLKECGRFGGAGLVITTDKQPQVQLYWCRGGQILYVFSLLTQALDVVAQSQYQV